MGTAGWWRVDPVAGAAVDWVAIARSLVEGVLAGAVVLTAILFGLAMVLPGQAVMVPFAFPFDWLKALILAGGVVLVGIPMARAGLRSGWFGLPQ